MASHQAHVGARAPGDEGVLPAGGVGSGATLHGDGRAAGGVDGLLRLGCVLWCLLLVGAFGSGGRGLLNRRRMFGLWRGRGLFAGWRVLVHGGVYGLLGSRGMLSHRPRWGDVRHDLLERRVLERCLLVLGGHYWRLTRMTVSPTCTSSPSRRVTGWSMTWPLTMVPLVEPRSSRTRAGP